jgi:NAD+ synthase (glutamine-hydrolysing)
MGQSRVSFINFSYRFDDSVVGLQYDCSSADINPIGGISKQDIRAFLRWGADNLGFKTLTEIEGAPPTAELEPITEKYTQVHTI